MPDRVDVNPEVLAWARRRSGLPAQDLAVRFPTLAAWERGERKPTFKQLESYAHATHTPVGFLFLPEPPREELPIPDYRTTGDTDVARPSADLLDTIYQCKERQDWYRESAAVNQERPVDLIGSLTTATEPGTAAAFIRTALRFDIQERGASFDEALRVLRDHAEDLGVLIMVDGVVGSNTHRKLDPREFRGFALVDRLAALVFVNGADTKAAQIFTLVHELAHLWLGATALDNADMAGTPSDAIEQWCNQVAAEVLVPLASIPAGRDELQALYAAEFRRVMGVISNQTSGGNFFATQPSRVGHRFARAVVASTLEGHTLYRDAFQLLGFRKLSTCNELATGLEASRA